MQRKLKKNEFCNKYASDSPKEFILRIQNAKRVRALVWIITGHTQASFKPFFTELYGAVGQWVCLVVFWHFLRIASILDLTSTLINVLIFIV